MVNCSGFGFAASAAARASASARSLAASSSARRRASSSAALGGVGGGGGGGGGGSTKRQGSLPGVYSRGWIASAAKRSSSTFSTGALAAGARLPGRLRGAEPPSSSGLRLL